MWCSSRSFRGSPGEIISRFHPHSVHLKPSLVRTATRTSSGIFLSCGSAWRSSSRMYTPTGRSGRPLIRVATGHPSSVRNSLVRRGHSFLSFARYLSSSPVTGFPTFRRRYSISFFLTAHFSRRISFKTLQRKAASRSSSSRTRTYWSGFILLTSMSKSAAMPPSASESSTIWRKVTPEYIHQPN